MWTHAAVACTLPPCRDPGTTARNVTIGRWSGGASPRPLLLLCIRITGGDLA